MHMLLTYGMLQPDASTAWCATGRASILASSREMPSVMHFCAALWYALLRANFVAEDLLLAGCPFFFRATAMKAYGERNEKDEFFMHTRKLHDCAAAGKRSQKPKSAAANRQLPRQAEDHTPALESSRDGSSQRPHRSQGHTQIA